MAASDFDLEEFRRKMKALLRGPVPVLLLLCHAALAQQLPRDMNSNDITWMDTLSRKLRAESATFDTAHPFKGHVAAAAIVQLQSEGFACDLRFANLGTPSKPELDPYVFCAMPTVLASDICKSRSVTLQIDWRSTKVDREELVAQLKTLPVAHQYFYCESRESGPPK